MPLVPSISIFIAFDLATTPQKMVSPSDVDDDYLQDTASLLVVSVAQHSRSPQAPEAFVLAGRVQQRTLDFDKLPPLTLRAHYDGGAPVINPVRCLIVSRCWVVEIRPPDSA